MRGIIMKKGKLGSVILTDDGHITKVMTRKDFCVGKEIPMEKRRKINVRRLAMVAAALVLVLGMASFGVAGSTTSYSVNLDVNPSLTFNVNTFNVIIEVVANNEDAEPIVEFVDLVGLKLNDGIKQAIEWLQEQGYLQDEDVLVISVEGNNEKTRQITRFIETEYEEEALEEEEGGRPGFEVMVGRITPEMFAKAEELGVPVGKIVLITKAMENGADIDYDAATELSVQEIQKINKLNANIMRMVALMNREK
ncbi:MAG: anti-sigma factor domain-containing protein, partial [Clostridia bacterium]